MKTAFTTRIQYFKGCRSTVRRTPHDSDSKWLADMHKQLGLVSVPPVREEAEKRFDRIVARRQSLNCDSPRFQKEVVNAFDEMIEYLEQNDR